MFLTRTNRDVGVVDCVSVSGSCMNKYFEFKKLVGQLAIQWSSSNLFKVDSYVAIGVIQCKVAVLNHP